jgi:pyrroloquinoline quinone biosynthesis protein B
MNRSTFFNLNHPWNLLLWKSIYFYSLSLFILFSCHPANNSIDVQNPSSPATEEELFVVVLGIAQDAGYPQIGCRKMCCNELHNSGQIGSSVTALGIIDQKDSSSWLIEATPDISSQWHTLGNLSKSTKMKGIALTHAHIGHYTGLMYLGRESLGSSQTPVYIMPKMKYFLENNGPWNQLVDLQNISLNLMLADSSVLLNERIKLTPILVPHRDEYSETVGFFIEGPSKRILFLPDIDKWGKWNHDLIEILETVDLAFIDGTFYKNGELPNRDMSEIPHPFMEETMELLSKAPISIKNKVHFIHFNHTNPVLRDTSIQSEIEARGFRIAQEGMRINLLK